MASFENQVNAGQNLLARPARRDRAPPQPEGKGKRMARIFIRRVYDAPAPDEGQRVLVDRLWPRGISHERLGEDTPWLKAIAPSDELRHWFDHDLAKWPEFQRRYAAELDANPGPVAELRTMIARGPVTLLFAAHDAQHNNAVALRAYLMR